MLTVFRIKDHIEGGVAMKLILDYFDPAKHIQIFDPAKHIQIFDPAKHIQIFDRVRGLVNSERDCDHGSVVLFAAFTVS